MRRKVPAFLLLCSFAVAPLAPVALAQRNSGNYYNGVRGSMRGGNYNQRYDRDRHDRNRHDKGGGIGPGYGALIGGGGGAALGAIFGGGMKGTLIGGAAGAGLGALGGAIAQKSGRDDHRRHR